MVGNVRDAMQCTNGVLIGEGCYRKAWLYNAVVYKVLYNSDNTRYGLADENQDEVEAVWSVLNEGRLPAHISVPPVTNYQFDTGELVSVNAMPFIEGRLVGECFCSTRELATDIHKTSCIPQSIVDEINDLTGLLDLGYGNVILDDNGVYHVIDCQQ